MVKSKIKLLALIWLVHGQHFLGPTFSRTSVTSWYLYLFFLVIVSNKFSVMMHARDDQHYGLPFVFECLFGYMNIYKKS